MKSVTTKHNTPRLLDMITVCSKWVTIMTTMLVDMLAEWHILNSTRVLSVHKN